MLLTFIFFYFLYYIINLYWSFCVQLYGVDVGGIVDNHCLDSSYIVLVKPNLLVTVFRGDHIGRFDFTRFHLTYFSSAQPRESNYSSKLSAMGISDGGQSRNAPCAIHYIYLLLIFFSQDRNLCWWTIRYRGYHRYSSICGGTDH